ncbi:MAG: HlyD family efflux transporter periplasmic adaptor subunit [Bacteroidaceae bacterium]|nr:HlyD family efflux transporter periplasmic adaptor subunit [Bacteroidaceae bacterium]
MKCKQVFYGGLFGIFFLSSCHSSPSPTDEVQAGALDSASVTATQHKQEPIETTVLQGKTFYQELAGTGKVTASRSAEVRFKTVERIAHVWVRNGQRVQAGQKLAELDKFRLERSLAQAKDNLEQSRLNLQDILIGRGFSLEEIDSGLSLTLPKREGAEPSSPPLGESEGASDFHLAAIKSGYNKALIAYELAAKELEQATLTAPFSGVVANLTAKVENLSSTGEPFCLVIDDAHPEVAFTVLEIELPMVRPGYSVSVIPFAERDPQARVWGEVTEVNPYVESNGMVKVKARVSNNGRLIEGMNVKVTMRQPMGERLVIPKSAVVMRSGKPVVFTLTRGKAQWNYVEVLAENSDSCTVAPRTKEYEGLSAGDTVIVKGNLNLAHDSEISYK